MGFPHRYRDFSAVCFDLDGVLIDTMPLHARAWQEALAQVGRRVTRREIYLWEGESGSVTARTLLARAGSRPSARAVRRLLTDKECRFNRLARRVTVDRRSMALLGGLARHGLRLGLVTGTSRREVNRVVPDRVLQRFEVIVTGDRVRRGKPHPEPYRTAFRRLRVAPRRVAVVENAPYGIRSARGARAGLIIALASSLPRRFLRDADLVVGTTKALGSALMRLTETRTRRYNNRRR